MEFRDTLKKIMDEKGCIPAELSRLSGVTEASISYYLSGSQTPSSRTVFKLAKALGVSVDILLGTPFAKNDEIKVYDERDNIVVLDDETREIIDELRKRPEKKMLFSVTRGASTEDIIRAVKIIEALREKEDKEGE